MATTQQTIRDWIDRPNYSSYYAQFKDATHMLVVCDTFDWEDYPVFVMPDHDVKTEYNKYNGPNMQKVMEVYNLKMDIETQLNQHRVMNF